MKQYILIGILLELLQNEKIKASELSSKFEVSTRTVYRYLDALESAGVPTITFIGKNGGIGIDSHFKIDKGFLTCEERDFLLSTLNNSQCTEITQSLITKLNYFNR